jgi:predicted dienelactone hydrolase
MSIFTPSRVLESRIRMKTIRKMLESIGHAGRRRNGARFMALYGSAGSFSVAEMRDVWTDGRSGRRIPVKLYLPAPGSGPHPLVVFSHGLGGSRETYAYLGGHWASHGFAAAHVQHPGTDKRIFDGKLDAVLAMRDAARHRESVRARPADVRFAIDRILEANRNGNSPLAGAVDPERIGVAGHSMGAATALFCAGRLFSGGANGPEDLSDPRIRACIAMSATSGDLESSRPEFAGFRVPCLHMTGTRDSSPIGGTRREHRRVPFDAIGGADQMLITFRGADHMAFSDMRPRRPASPGQRTLKLGRLGLLLADRGLRRPGSDDLLYHRLIRAVTTAFLDATLNGSPDAQAWLAGGGLRSALAGLARVEVKSAKGKETAHGC